MLITSTIALGLACTAIGCLFGYHMRNKPSPNESEGVLERLCGVIELQSNQITESGRRSLDAAVVESRDQIDRISAERMAEAAIDLRGRTDEPEQGGYLDTGPQDGFESQDIPTEIPG